MNSFSPPLVFVYLGRELPNYTDASVAFAAGAHDGKTVLLTDAERLPPASSKYSVERISSWYDRSAFERFAGRSRLDPTFRDGFWLKTVERFFVLRDFLLKENCAELFHAELDVLVLDLHGVAHTLNSYARGLFVVADSAKRALASLFFVNSPETLDHFLEFLQGELDEPNEMRMLGNYLRQFPEKCHSFPSPLDLGTSEIADVSALRAQIGVFDANAIGQWLFGNDPRNEKLLSRNRWSAPVATLRLEAVRFHLGNSRRQLWAHSAGVLPVQIRTLHVHSKILNRLIRPGGLRVYLALARIPIRLPMALKKGGFASLLLTVLLKGVPFTLLRFGQYWPGVRGALEFLVQRAAKPLSDRQQRAFSKLFPVRVVSGDSETDLERCVVPENPEDVRQLLADLVRSPSDVLCETSHGLVSYRARGTSQDSRQILWISKGKTPVTVIPRMWPQVRKVPNFSIDTRALIVRGDWLNELVNGEAERLIDLLAGIDSPWDEFAALYGAWVVQEHRRSLTFATLEAAG